MPVLVEPDSTTAGVLSCGAARRHPGRRTTPTSVDGWLTGRGEYVVVLGPDARPDRRGAAWPSASGPITPGTSIVLARLELEPQVFAQAMQAGIGAVVAADDHAALGTAVEPRPHHLGGDPRPDRSRRRASATGQVITVFSPKGGVGKTTVAVNLGVALATAASAEVCLVDLDLAFGDVAITLQLIPEHTITEAVDVRGATSTSRLLETLLTRHESGLTILAAPTHPEGQGPDHRRRWSRRVLQTLRRHFDYVVIDTPPGFDDQVLGAFDETDECVLVATLDVPTVKNVKVAIETLDLLNLVPGHRHLRAQPGRRGGRPDPGQRRGHPEDEGRRRAAELARRRQRHQPRPPDRAVEAGPPGVQGAHRPRSPSSPDDTAHTPTPAEPAKRGLFGRKK